MELIYYQFWDIDSRNVLGDFATEQFMRYVALGVGDVIAGARPPGDHDGPRLFIEIAAPLPRKETVRTGAAAR